MPHAFWARNFMVAPVETAHTVNAALLQLFAAQPVGQPLDGVRRRLDGLPE